MVVDTRQSGWKYKLKRRWTAEPLQSFLEATAPSLGDTFSQALVPHLATTREVGKGTPVIVTLPVD